MNYDSESGDTADLDYYWESINMDDIATPGSFWLNPPLPKDDDGNSVNVVSVIQSYESLEEDTTTDEDSMDIHNPDDDDDGVLASILMDMDPLWNGSGYSIQQANSLLESSWVKFKQKEF